jgi:hypothetical protein
MHSLKEIFDTNNSTFSKDEYKVVEDSCVETDGIISNTSNKEIVIKGQTNRYLMKKLIKPKNEDIKVRKEIQKLNISEDMFLEKNQEVIIQNLYNNIDFTYARHVKQMIDKKLSSYKQQDLKKNMYNSEKFITFSQVIEKLNSCNMDCFYCKKKTFLLYEIVRELSQWTLDRINNNIGHNEENVIIACLVCNLKRKQINKDAYLFTKQLVITRNS